MNDPWGHADRQSPKWSRPLAPLPEWLESVEEILEELRQAERVFAPHLDPGREQRFAEQRLAWRRSARVSWMVQWRERLGLTPAEAAKLLGYANEKEIRQIENEIPVRRKLERQMQLVVDLAPDAVRNRSQWLHCWRLRMGFTCRHATEILGYHSAFNLYRAETGVRSPSWEKILVALAEERFVCEAVEHSPTDVRLLSNTV